MSQEFARDKQHANDDLDIELTDPATGSEGATPSVHIVFDVTVRQQIVEFAMTDTSRELGGVLIGTIEQGERPIVRITAMISARHTDARNASVTFTHETWQDILAIKDRVYPDRKIVGWFHTHPGFGIFLSRFDMHIHENFFNLDWQIAYVVDPLANTEGFFRWENGKVQKTLDFNVIGELPPIAAAPPTPQPLPMAPPPGNRTALSWHYLVIAGLLAGVIYLQFFRPPKTIMPAPPRVANPAPTVASPSPPTGVRPAPTVSNDAVPLPVKARPTTGPATANPIESWPVYHVQPNDSLWEISRRCYGDGSRYDVIVAANKLNSRRIVPGMQLRIPGGNLPPISEGNGKEAPAGKHGE